MTLARAAQMITREEAEQIAASWVIKGLAPGDAPPTPVVHEFDLGFVVWGQPPPGSAPVLGAGRGLIDRETGELSVWPSLPLDLVIERFRTQRERRPPVPHTWAPADQLRRELRRPALTPTNLTRLTLADQMITARGVKGDGRPNLHRHVRAYLAGLPPEERERGYERCSEAAALSDALHAEDARRAVAGADPITLEQARTGLFAGAVLVTYRVREPGDPAAGHSAPPCVSCALLCQHFGFALHAPARHG